MNLFELYNRFRRKGIDFVIRNAEDGMAICIELKKGDMTIYHRFDPYELQNGYYMDYMLDDMETALVRKSRKNDAEWV